MLKTRILIASVTLALCLGPIAAVALAALLSGMLGCDVNEGAPLPCEVFGFDLGGVLYGLMTTGWLALITIPLLMAALVVWLAVEGALYLRKQMKTRRAGRAGGSS